MKKKTMAFGGLLAAVAMTGYSVAGTYAKYISQIDLVDEARVAKWSLTAADNCVQDEHGSYSCQKATKLNLFSESYYNNGKLYVKSLDGDNVIAPGTKGEYQVNLSGTMEVRHKLDIDFSADKAIAVSYNVDEKGNIAVDADGNLEISTDLTEYDNIYRPITYTVNFFEGNQQHALVSGTDLTEVQKELDNKLGTLEFEPAKRLLYSVNISWYWNTENDVTGINEGQVDLLDTFIGNNLAPWINSSHDVQDIGGNSEYTLSITATQVAEDHSVRAN